MSGYAGCAALVTTSVTPATPRRCACRPRRRSCAPTASISCVGQRLVARLQRHRDRDRLLARIDALALVDVEHRDAGDQLAVGGLRGAHDVAGLDARGRPRRRSRARPAGTATARAPAWRASAFAFGSGILSRITSKATSGPSASSASSARGCSSPKWPSTFCGPIWIVPRAAGMEPGRAARHDLQRLRRRAGGGEHRERVGLGVEGIDLGRRARPVAADAATPWPAPRRTPRRGGELILRLVAAKICPTSNSATSAKPRSALRLRRARSGPGAGSAACRRGRRRSDWRAPARACRRRTARPAASTMNDQVTASTMPRAASARLALRVRIWIGVSTGLRGAVAAVERRRRDAVDADDAHDLLDDVGLAVDVRPPRRHRDLHVCRPGRRRRSRDAPSTRLISGRPTSRPASRLQLARAGNR